VLPFFQKGDLIITQRKLRAGKTRGYRTLGTLSINRWGYNPMKKVPNGLKIWQRERWRIAPNKIASRGISLFRATYTFLHKKNPLRQHE